MNATAVCDMGRTRCQRAVFEEAALSAIHALALTDRYYVDL